MGSAGRGGEELCERDGLAGAVRKGEVGNALTDLGSTGGSGDVAGTVKEGDGTGGQHGGENGETGAEDFAAIELRVAESADQADEQHEQGENGEHEAEPGEPSRGEVDE